MLDLYLRGVLWVQQIFVPAEAARWERLLWRRRVGVEPTIRSAKERIAGFEGRESHRTLFASAGSIAEGADLPGTATAFWAAYDGTCGAGTRGDQACGAAVVEPQ